SAPRRHSGEDKLTFKQAGCLWDHRQNPLQPWPKRLSRTERRTSRGVVASPLTRTQDNRSAIGLPSKDRRAAQLPERPSSTCSSPTLRAICGPLHRGPISRPYPHREPVLIGVPLELTAYPT